MDVTLRPRAFSDERKSSMSLGDTLSGSRSPRNERKRDMSCRYAARVLSARPHSVARYAR